MESVHRFRSAVVDYALKRLFIEYRSTMENPTFYLRVYDYGEKLARAKKEYTDRAKETIKFLVSMGANINIRFYFNSEYTGLMMAAENNFVELAEFLLAAGIDPDLKNGNGERALDLANKKHNTAIIELINAKIHRSERD